MKRNFNSTRIACNTRCKALRKTTLPLFMLISLIVILTGCVGSGFNENLARMEEPVGPARKYAELETVSEFETPYIGDASKVGGIISKLPALSDFYIQNYFSLDTDQPPYGLTVYYEAYNNSEGKQNPFMTSFAENNALILFAYIDNLDNVTFAFREEPSQGELEESKYKPRYAYSRKELEEKFGNITELKQDLPEFYGRLAANLLIDPEYMHYNRITLGSSLEHIIYRNGEPDGVIKSDDGPTVIIYQNLGEVTYHPPDGESPVTIPGSSVTFYLDPDYEVLYKISASAASSSEILWNLNIEEGAYEEVIENLGTPAKETVSEDGSLYVSYLLKNTESDYVYFVFSDGHIVEYGLETVSDI